MLHSTRSGSHSVLISTGARQCQLFNSKAGPRICRGESVRQALLHLTLPNVPIIFLPDLSQFLRCAAGLSSQHSFKTSFHSCGFIIYVARKFILTSLTKLYQLPYCFLQLILSIVKGTSLYYT